MSELGCLNCKGGTMILTNLHNCDLKAFMSSDSLASYFLIVMFKLKFKFSPGGLSR